MERSPGLFEPILPHPRHTHFPLFPQAFRCYPWRDYAPEAALCEETNGTNGLLA